MMRVLGLVAVVLLFSACTLVSDYDPDSIDWGSSSARGSSSAAIKFDIKRGVFIDGRDGYVYNYIYVAGNAWLAENLRYLPEISSSEFSSTEPKYYVAEYLGHSLQEAKRTDNFATCGALYNYEAAKTSCPEGWRLPTQNEWHALLIYYENYVYANRMLRSTIGWPNYPGTDDYGFTALPCGSMRRVNYVGGEAEAVWFIGDSPKSCLTVFDDRGAATIFYECPVDEGFSVRCVKNAQ